MSGPSLLDVRARRVQFERAIRSAVCVEPELTRSMSSVWAAFGSNVATGADMDPLERDVGLIDCGQVSRKTQGLPFLVAVENGFAPFNTFRFYL